MTDGHIAFGTADGMVSFCPDSLKQAHTTAKRLHLTAFVVGSEEANTLTRSNGRKVMDKPVGDCHEFSLSYVDAAFRMDFSLLNFDFVTIVVNDKDEIVGVGVGMPDVSHALRKCKGRLFPFGWIRLLRALKAKQMDAFDLLLIGVRPDYQGMGVNAVIIADQHPYFRKYGIQRVETTSIMETNTRNIANWEMFPHKQHKRRRAYMKQIY